MSVAVESGTISVHMENIFPIVKKALYNDKEIFLRELVSNAVDAINKHKHLAMIGDAEKEAGEYRIDLRYDKEAGVLTISDNGLGLTAAEIKKYINEVAFSSAQDFMEKFKDQAAQIIGHFGLGFYSAFMVAEKVEIHSLSYQQDAEAVIWSCDGSPHFEMRPGDRSDRGTEIRLTLMKDETEFAEEPRLQHLIRKYCDFMPYPIYLAAAGVEPEKPANRQEALWNRNPKEVSDQEYLDFYQYLFPFAPEPHLWIHLNVEVPFNLKGILYFPKLVHEMDPSKGQIKLFVNNVFVSDQSEEFLPKFLVTLQGGLDCPDIPLNVSRSMLQNDPYVQKVSGFITRKVADRLKEMFNKDKEAFIKTWDDIHTFIKFGVMEDDKFYDKIKDILLFKTSSDDYVTLDEYLARNPKLDKKVYYTSEEMGQQRFVNLLKDQGIEVIYLNTLIDTHFIQFLEYKNTEIKFARVDSDIAESIVDEDQPSLVDPKTNQTGDEMLEELFKRELSQDKLTVKVQPLKSDEVPALIVLPEQMRRLYEMTRFMQGANPGESEKLLQEHTLLLNSRHPLLQTLRKFAGSQSEQPTVHLLVEHIYDLAMLSHRPLNPSQMEKFMSNANKVLQLVAKKMD